MISLLNIGGKYTGLTVSIKTTDSNVIKKNSRHESATFRSRYSAPSG